MVSVQASGSSGQGSNLYLDVCMSTGKLNADAGGGGRGWGKGVGKGGGGIALR